MQQHDTNEEMAMKVFGLIAGAGDAKSNFYQAMNLIQENKNEEAEELLQQGEAALLEAHKVQTSLITDEANGKKTEVGILMVHAQDHLMNAILVKELLGNLITMQKEINTLKAQLGGQAS